MFAQICEHGIIISIHALCEEGDECGARGACRGTYFYPRPLRGGRRASASTTTRSIDFYPRPLRGGRPFRDRQVNGFDVISIHALCEEGDAAIPEYYWRKLISIHALCEEGDQLKPGKTQRRYDFYPRPLRGGRQEPVEVPDISKIFLSTPSARRATDFYFGGDSYEQISIHALCEEGDSKNRDKISIFKQIIQHSARI